jgi:hypothetical protein
MMWSNTDMDTADALEHFFKYLCDELRTIIADNKFQSLWAKGAKSSDHQFGGDRYPQWKERYSDTVASAIVNHYQDDKPGGNRGKPGI